ncbi:hypothetical protein B9Z19DRAFT_1087922 [Tuber borchii]|uniref:Uncharacterized protein n=1 Tax=Tuber borchii TaxID=42251 RepID=A0A2T6ZME9_TUBBO|nr:hypothetical protein B9Z19DRAFT_1087922 [Tuber borchii]
MLCCTAPVLTQYTPLLLMLGNGFGAALPVEISEGELGPGQEHDALPPKGTSLPPVSRCLLHCAGTPNKLTYGS